MTDSAQNAVENLLDRLAKQNVTENSLQEHLDEFKSVLQDSHSIPFLSNTKRSSRDLVKMVGMVQDVLDIEFVVPSAVFKDTIDVPVSESIDLKSMIKRQSIRVVPIPGASPWSQSSEGNPFPDETVQVVLYASMQDVVSVCGGYVFYGLVEESVDDRKRLHCLYMSSLSMNARIGESYGKARPILLQYLCNQLKTDLSVAEYLLLHLISKVTSRVPTGTLMIGTFPLNLITHGDDTEELMNDLKKIYLQLLPQSISLNLSLKSLEDDIYTSKKDLETNQMEQGKLHVITNTFILCDETRMEIGKLSSKAFDNIKALQTLITEQTISLDFQYHQVQIPINAPVLSVSKDSKSILAFPHKVHWTRSSPSPLEPQPSLDAFREYLSDVSSHQVSIEDSFADVITNDLDVIRDMYGVETQSDLAESTQKLVNMAKLLAVSFKSPLVLKEHWEKAIEMEKKSFQEYHVLL